MGGGFGLWLEGFGLGGGRMDRDVERVAKNAMERVFGDMVVLGGGRDRERNRDRF